MPSQNHLPAALNEVVNGPSELARMDPGESTWTIPWSMQNVGGEIKISEKPIERGRGMGGTSTLKVFKDFEGIVLDATALPLDDL